MMRLTTLLAALTFALSAVTPGQNIAETVVDKDGITLYTLQDIEGTDVAVSGTKCEVSQMSGDDYEKYTLYLTDVSSSTNETAQNTTINILEELIDGQDKSVSSAIATFSENMTLLGSYTSDRYELSKTVQRVEFNGGNTNLYSSVIEAADNVKAAKGAAYGRIVVISDGVEANRDGITYNELSDYLDDCSVQVFTIGIDTGKNSQNLKNLSAMSRETNALGYVVNADSDIDGICREINEYMSKLNAYSIMVPDELKDGSVKRLSILENGAEIEGVDIRMPVMIRETTQAATSAEPTETVATELTTVLTESSVQQSESTATSTDGVNITLIIVIAAAALVVVGAIVIVIVVLNKKKTAENTDKQGTSSSSSGNKTEIYTEDNGDNKTSLLFGNGALFSQNEAELTLKELESGDHNYRFTVNDEGTVITREKLPDAVMQVVIDHDKSVSQNHCTLVLKNDEIFIHDNGSKNKTHVNGKEVTDEKALKEGDIIRLGRVKLRVEKINL